MCRLCCRPLAVCAAALVVALIASLSPVPAMASDDLPVQASFVRLETAALAPIDAETPIDADGSHDVVGTPIKRGWVLLQRQWLKAPYVVSQRGGEVFINDVLIPQDKIFPEFGLRGGMRGRRDGWPDDPARFLHVRLESALLHHGLLIQFSDGTVGVFRDGDSQQILRTLISDKDLDAKLQVVIDLGLDRFTSNQWQAVIESFPPTEQVLASLKAYDEAHEPEEPIDAYGIGPVQHDGANYVLTMIGMSLAVLSFGVVMSHRPQAGAKWRQINASSDSMRLVVYCAVLIVALSAFDLACTYLADRAGGFLEVNPIAKSLLASPLHLVAFKVGFTALSVTLLLKLRRYHGMQIASWWLCLALTLLTVRWVAFHSLMMA
jgi:hypothetical protein